MDLRIDLASAYRAYRNILVLTSNLSLEERARMDHSIAMLPAMPSKQLRALRPKINAELKRAINYYGVTASRDELEQLATGTMNGERVSHGNLLNVAKWGLQQWFKSYERCSPLFAQLPPHGRVSIDVHGRYETKGKVEIFLLEASLFEDMAALWNDALVTSRLEDVSKPVSHRKRIAALTRATAKAAFSLVEGYLNGLAADIAMTQQLSPNELALVTEWDADRQRPKTVSLREKLIVYPRIATGSRFPLFDENTSPEMKTLLELEQSTRHALIHPKLQAQNGIFREQAYSLLTLEQVSNLCDVVVAIIKNINTATGEKFGSVDWWLFARDMNGFYPDAAFA